MRQSLLVAGLLIASPQTASGQACPFCDGPESDIAIWAAGFSVLTATGVAYSRANGGFQTLEVDRLLLPIAALLATTGATFYAGYSLRDHQPERFEGALLGSAISAGVGGLLGPVIAGTEGRLAAAVIGVGTGVVAGGAIGAGCVDSWAELLGARNDRLDRTLYGLGAGLVAGVAVASLLGTCDSEEPGIQAGQGFLVFPVIASFSF